MRLRSMACAALVFICLNAQAARGAFPPASPEQKDYLLYLLMTTPNEQERNSTIYRIFELARGVEMYRRERRPDNRVDALTSAYMRDLQADEITTGHLLPIRDEEEYVREKSKQIDRYINQNPIRDLAVGGVISVIAGRVVGNAQGAVADFVKSFVQSSGDAILKDIKQRYSLKTDYAAFEKAVELIYSLNISSPAGMRLIHDIKSSLKIDLWSNLSQDPRSAGLAAQKSLRNLEEKQRYFMAEIRTKLEASTRPRFSPEMPQLLRSSARGMDTELDASDFEKRREEYSAWKKSMEERRDNLRAFFQGAYAAGKILNLNDEQMHVIEDFGKLSQIVHDLDVGRYNNQPVQEASLYIMAAQIMIGFLKNKDTPENPLAILSRQIQQLAIRLEAIRNEMHERFSMVDFAIARYFDQTFSVLRVLQRDSEDQLRMLDVLADNFRTLQQALNEYFQALANRQNDMILAECLPGMNLSSNQVGPCLRKAELIAIKWPRDAIQTESFNPAQADREGIRPGEQASLFSSNLPWLERFVSYWGSESNDVRAIVRNSGSPVVNPDSWLTGSALFTHIMLVKPEVTASFSADVFDPFIEQGQSVQKFFRNLVFDANGKLQRDLIGNILRMYERKMQAAAEAFESYLKALSPLPLRSTDQELPEEIVSGEERARARERRTASYVRDIPFNEVKTPLNNLPRVSDPGRGAFGPVEGKAKPQLLSEAVRKCHDYSHDLPWPAAGKPGNTPQHEYYRPRFTIPDNALQWDTSFLALIPRAALWADRVFEDGKLIACVPYQFTQLEVAWDLYRYWLLIEVRLEFEATMNIADKSIKRRFRVAKLETAMLPSHPAAGRNIADFRDVGITPLWNGGAFGGVGWGPMRGHFDRLFFARQDPIAQRDLIELSILVQQEVNSRKVNLYKAKERPEVKKALDEARAYRSLLLSILRQGFEENSPGGSVLINPLIMHRRAAPLRLDPKDDKASEETYNIALTTPEGLILAMTDGYSAEEMKKLLSSQILRYLRDAAFVDEAKLNSEMKTPVDEQVSLLLALKTQHAARLRQVSSRR